MEFIKQWWQKRSNQWLVLMIGIQLFLLISFIVPVFEEIEYFDKKIQKLELQYDRLESFSHHLDEYEKNLQWIQEQIESFQQIFPYQWGIEELVLQLTKMSRKYQLFGFQTKVDSPILGNSIEYLKISLLFQSQYEAFQKYMKKLDTIDERIIVSNINIENNEFEALEVEPNLRFQIDLLIVRLNEKNK